MRSQALSVDAYLRRVGLHHRPDPDEAGLRELHLAHATKIPFENLDIQMGLPIRLDLDALQGKLVDRRRGGYCFEQNTLFLAVLRELGFEAEPFEARVRMGQPGPLPRTHMLLGVRLDGGWTVADVGFGGQGLMWPVPMDGLPHRAFRDELRVVPEGPVRVLQSRQGLAWQELYAFEPVPRPAVDFDVANWYTSTHPDSRFVKTLTAQLPGPDTRRILRGRSYTVVGPDRAEERILEPDEIAPLLLREFGLDVPEGARLG